MTKALQYVAQREKLEKYEGLLDFEILETEISNLSKDSNKINDERWQP